MWVMPAFVRVGRVVDRRGISLLVLFQGDALPTPIPDAYQYWDPYPPPPAPENTIHPTSPPTNQVLAATGDSISVKQAGHILGRHPKQIRQMLRAGTLQGHQKGGLWAGVDHASVRRLQAGGSLATD